MIVLEGTHYLFDKRRVITKFMKYPFPYYFLIITAIMKKNKSDIGLKLGSEILQRRQVVGYNSYTNHENIKSTIPIHFASVIA